MAACRPPPAQPAVVPPLIAGCIIEDAGQLAVRQLKSLNYGAGKTYISFTNRDAFSAEHASTAELSVACGTRGSMNDAPEQGLLAAGDPPPVAVYNGDGRSPFLLVADHAGNVFPRALGRLGISAAEAERHIALDIGIANLSRMVADALNAALIQQNYSRLVIDCNRPPGAVTSIPEISELTPIPGNVGLSTAERTARQREIFQPYHDAIAAALEHRQQANAPAALIALHSFTPVFKAAARPWHAALLYHRDPRLARALLALLRNQAGLNVGDNEPYFVSDETDYTIPIHGERRNIPHALIEIRQDLLVEEKGQREWAQRLARLLPEAYRSLR
jgi:predicted N-formylglutamate amidohydrolase